MLEQAEEALNISLGIIDLIVKKDFDETSRSQLKRAYMKTEYVVFLLKLATDDESAGKMDGSLFKEDMHDLLKKAYDSAASARIKLSKDVSYALLEARISRDCLRVLLHLMNIEAKRGLTK